MAGKSCLTLHWSQLRVLRSCWISKEEVTRDILTFMVLRTLLFQIYNYSTDANLHYVQLGFQREKSLKADLTLSARLVVERRGEGRRGEGSCGVELNYLSPPLSLSPDPLQLHTSHNLCKEWPLHRPLVAQCWPLLSAFTRNLRLREKYLTWHLECWQVDMLIVQSQLQQVTMDHVTRLMTSSASHSHLSEWRDLTSWSLLDTRIDTTRWVWGYCVRGGKCSSFHLTWSCPGWYPGCQGHTQRSERDLCAVNWIRLTRKSPLI